MRCTPQVNQERQHKGVTASSETDVGNINLWLQHCRFYVKGDRFSRTLTVSHHLPGLNS